MQRGFGIVSIEQSIMILSQSAQAKFARITPVNNVNKF